MYIITGFIFSSEVAARSQVPDERLPFSLVEDMYSGIVASNRGQFEQGADGILQYKGGLAKICEWRKGSTGFSFSLWPLHQSEVSYFSFDMKEGTSWLGTCLGPVVETRKGFVSCLISKCDERSLSAAFVENKLRHP